MDEDVGEKSRNLGDSSERREEELNLIYVAEGNPSTLSSSYIRAGAPTGRQS